jgi:hypothetical protein
MQTYVLMVDLTPEQEEGAREQLQNFLEGRTGTDQELAVQGLQFLRARMGPQRSIRTRGRRPAVTASE